MRLRLEPAHDGKQLAHRQVQITARSARFAADPVQAAAEPVTANIAFILDGSAARGLRTSPSPERPPVPEPK